MRLFLLTLLTLAAMPLWASEPATGTLSMKLSAPQLSVRDARQRLTEVDKEIARLDRNIADTRGQAQTARATGGTNAVQASVLNSLVGSYEMQKAELVSERSQLIDELKSAKQ